MVKPTKLLDWTDGAAAKVQEPNAAKKLLGFITKEKPSPLEFNWLLHFTDLWIKYFDGEIDLLIGLQSTFDYVVGVGGTHADINALVADVAVLPYSRVLIKDAATLTITQTISKEGLDFTFHPRAHYSKGATLGIGIDVTANRVKLKDGRFLNFNEAGGRGIRLSATADNCYVQDNTFVATPTEIEDLGANNTLTGNKTEV